jgi:hypothetical protein
MECGSPMPLSFFSTLADLPFFDLMPLVFWSLSSPSVGCYNSYET